MTERIASAEKSTVLTNIFNLPDGVGLEDRFTAAWGYVLNRETALAQAVADILLKDTGLAAKVIRVTDHPTYNSFKRPDFRIECVGLDILVEHKVAALLHENQLENYLRFETPDTWVALIAPAYQSVPANVLAAPRYLKPEGRVHFKWSDFYVAVKSQPGWLTQEFADYMKSLGMAPFTLKSDEDLFDLRAKPTQFEDALKSAAIRVFSDNAGCSFKGTPTGLGREVRRPNADLTLIYIWAEQRASSVEDCEGPVLAVNVYERDVAGTTLLPDANMGTPSGISLHRRQLAKPVMQGEGLCRTTYAAPLAQIVQATRDETIHCMAEMLAAVRADFF